MKKVQTNRVAVGWIGVLFSCVLGLSSGCATYARRMPYSMAAMPMPLAADVVDTSQPGDGTRVAEDGNVEQTTNALDRIMAYDATLHIVVSDADNALMAMKTIGVNLGGYMQSLSGSAIVLKIPAARLNEAIRQIEALGEVAARRITGLDVTEEMMDLDIRLRNLQETRDRLSKLLEKAVKVDEVLAIEKELQRVTENLELMKGRIQYLSHSVKYSTLTVNVNAPMPQAEVQDVVPVAWVRELGPDKFMGRYANYSPDQRFRRWLKMSLPPNCVKLSESKGRTLIMSGSGVMILVQREENFENGGEGFWAPLVRRSLTVDKAMAVGDWEQVKLDTGVSGQRLSGTRRMGRRTYQYELWLVCTDDDVYTFECWGEAEEMTRMRPQLEVSAKSMDIRP